MTYAEKRTRPFVSYVQSISNVLTTYLGWHRARLKFIARFQAALLMRQTTDLAKLAASLKGGVQIASNYRRIQRFLSGYEVDFTALGRLLVHLLPQNGPYVAVLDRTEWHVGQTPVNILMVGVAHDGVAVPIAWTHLVGEKRALWDGPPPNKAHQRRAKSLFRHGLDGLQHLLTTPERQDAALFHCLSLLHRPTAHLPSG